VREIRGGVPGNDRKVMCYKCKGVKTHHQRSKPFPDRVAVMVYFTIKGEVLEGYCLHCYFAEDIPKYANGSTRGTDRNSCRMPSGVSTFMGTYQL